MDRSTVGIYLRISKDPLNLAAGVERQRADCLTICAARWPDAIVTEYVDNDVSASRYSRRRTRPAYTQMCADIEAGALGGVVAWDMDRLMRQPRDLESFIETCDAARMHSVVTAQSDLDLSSPDGLFRARILAAVAAKESDDKSRRIRRVAQDRRERGLHHGSRVVYGYRLVDRAPTPVPDQVALVQEAATRALSGESLNSIHRWLAEADPAAPQSRTGLRKMLLSPTLVGRTTDGTRGSWPATLTDDQHADLLAMLRSPERRRRAPSGTRRWWITGLAVCGTCDATLLIQKSRAGWAHRCPDHHVSILAVPFQAHVEVALFDTVQVARRETPAPVVDTGRADRLAELAALYASGEITRDEWMAARATAPASPVPQPAVAPPPRNLADLWDGLSPEQQHHAASRVIDTVTVLPWTQGKGRWQPERIAITWRA